MRSSQVPDLVILVVCAVLLLLYNFLYFNVTTFSILGTRYVNIYAINKRSRQEWLGLLSADPKEGINAVQTLRNMTLGVSLLAAAMSAVISQLINVLTSPDKLQQVAEFSTIDPITDIALLSPQVKLGIGLGLLLLAMGAFAQSVRLSIHVGFLVRVVAADPTSHRAMLAQASTFMRRSSLYFAVGLRLLFAWMPLILYVLGPTSLLIATLLVVAAQLLSDVVPEAECCEQAGGAAGSAADGEEGGWVR